VGPAILHYLDLTILLMFDVPLTLTAWKVQRGYRRRGRMFLVIVGAAIGLVGLLEARFALQRGVEPVGFKTAIVLLWTLSAFIHGIGTRPRVNDSTLNYSEDSAAARG
jgi:hypothetical protein